MSGQSGPRWKLHNQGDRAVVWDTWADTQGKVARRRVAPDRLGALAQALAGCVARDRESAEDFFATWVQRSPEEVSAQNTQNAAGPRLHARVIEHLPPEASAELAKTGYTIVTVLQQPMLLQALHLAARDALGVPAFEKELRSANDLHQAAKKLAGVAVHLNFTAKARRWAVARMIGLCTVAPRVAPNEGGEAPHVVLHGAAARALDALYTAIVAVTGARRNEVAGADAMAALPGGEGQRVHMDGPQANLALVIALEAGTRATRFAGANADARKWDDCAEVRQLRAGEAVLFDTARWHAGPAQPTGAGVRVTLFVPLTGACWRRQGASDVAPVFLGEQAAA